METVGLLVAAGLGTRLGQLTKVWPKCLMPIHGRPLLHYWLSDMAKSGVKSVLVNTHCHSSIVEGFLDRRIYQGWVMAAYEEVLLGTAGTIRANFPFLNGRLVLMAHADNWISADLARFIQYHIHERPKRSVMTMMTFECDEPSSCGIVEVDQDGIVQEFHEKSLNPPSNLANGAVYIIEPELVEWISTNPKISDFSNEVIPRFLGRIATWKNKTIHRDIGTAEALNQAQRDESLFDGIDLDDDWSKKFKVHPIHALIENIHGNK